MRLYDVNTGYEVYREFNSKLTYTNLICYIAGTNNNVVANIENRYTSTLNSAPDDVKFKNCKFYGIHFNCFIDEDSFEDCEFSGYCRYQGRTIYSVDDIKESNKKAKQERLAAEKLKEDFMKNPVGYKLLTKTYLIKLSIPEDAEVRGDLQDKLRVSKAKVEDITPIIEGIVGGQSYNELEYKLGETVEIENFDPSQASCSSGIHLCPSLERLKSYGNFSSRMERNVFDEKFLKTDDE